MTSSPQETTSFEVQSPSFDPTDSQIALGDGTSIFERVSVPIVWDKSLVTFDLRVIDADERGRPLPWDERLEVRVESLHYRNQQHGVSASNLRKMPFDEMRRAAIGQAIFIDSRDDQARAEASVERTKRYRRRREPMTDIRLARIAQVYDRAMSEDREPTKAVRLSEQVSDSTAARWVGLARAAGLLEPTTPGKKGGGITGKARRLLEEDSDGD